MSEQVEVSQPKFELTDEQKTINGILYTRIGPSRTLLM